jgi:hypothetical protein
MFHSQTTAIVSTGPLDTPILATGLPVFGRVELEPAPKKLTAKKPRRWRPGMPVEELAKAPEDPQLPTFSTLGPKEKLIRFTNNPHGLKSWSEMLYPEAYQDVSKIYWKQLTDDERRKIELVQARAMERVGYERGTEKLFIDEIAPQDGGRTDDTAGGGSSVGFESFVGLLVILAVIGLLVWSVMGIEEPPAPAPVGTSDWGE